MTCARCGGGVFKAEDQIIMNKVWHKCCFRCSRCNKILDKSSAKLFQGEIFCECCHVIVLEDFETLLKPCRVVSSQSSPSCICIKPEKQRSNRTPSFDYSKKYDICFPSEPKEPRNNKSCSCLPDVTNRSYCFAFPMPREVANYYNRTGMRKRNRYMSQKCQSNNEKSNRCQKNSEPHCPVKIRTLSPPRKRCSPVRCRSREDSPTGSHHGRCCRCPDYNSCSCNKYPECPRLIRCLPHREKSSPCTSCRDCRGCCCKECDVKPRVSSPRRRCYSPRRKPPCDCWRCSASPECPERPCHSPRPPCKPEYPCPDPPECPHHSHYCSERPHHPNSAPCNQEGPCYIKECMYCKHKRKERPHSCKCYPQCKDCPLSDKERPASPRDCKDYPRECKDYPRIYKECPRSYKICPPSCEESPLSSQESNDTCKDFTPSYRIRSLSPHDCKEFLPDCNPYPSYPTEPCCGRHRKNCRCKKSKKYCVCGKPHPCDCKMNQIRSECTSICVRCGCKVYAAEKICVSGGPYHTSCFSCVCCHKLLDVKNVYEHGGEIYCKHCYNNSMGNSYYGYS